jgi:predicted SprT family Zn-dependent metalloprotease
MTFGHGIVIRNGSHGRELIAHELAHVMQYERFGGIDAFLKEYIKEVAFPRAIRMDRWNKRQYKQRIGSIEVPECIGD